MNKTRAGLKTWKQPYKSGFGILTGLFIAMIMVFLTLIPASAADPADWPAPDITEVSLKGREVTLAGSGFGKNSGDAEIRKYMAGKESAVVPAETVTWNDTQVVLSLGEDFEGILEAELTAVNGKKDLIRQFIGKSRNGFETEHNLDIDTGDSFRFDPPDEEHPYSAQMGDSETRGIMMPLDGKIYYLPAVSNIQDRRAYRTFMCYDPAKDAWTNDNLP